MDLLMLLILPIPFRDYLSDKDLYVLSQVSKNLYQQTHLSLNKSYKLLLETDIFPNTHFWIMGTLRYCFYGNIKPDNFMAQLGYGDSILKIRNESSEWIEDDQLWLQPTNFVYSSQCTSRVNKLDFPHLLYNNVDLILNIAVIIKFVGRLSLDHVNGRVNELNHQLATRRRSKNSIAKDFEFIGRSFWTFYYLLSVEGLQSNETIYLSEPDIDDSSIIYDLQFISVPVKVSLGYYYLNSGKKRLKF